MSEIRVVVVVVVFVVVRDAAVGAKPSRLAQKASSAKAAVLTRLPLMALMSTDSSGGLVVQRVDQRVGCV